MLNFDIISVLPQLFDPHFEELPFKRARDKAVISTNIHNLRDFAVDNYGSVDDKPYGGGVGMVLMLEPLYRALHNIYAANDSEYSKIISSEKLIKVVPGKSRKIIVLSPKGEIYTQKKAKELSNMEQITLVCGRYEGIDERIADIADVEMISIGNYVLSGGELPALVLMESITRLLPGTIEKEEALQIESFTNDQLEYPQYTRPEIFKGVKVPEILLSGHHKKIQEWRNKNSKKVKNK